MLYFVMVNFDRLKIF